MGEASVCQQVQVTLRYSTLPWAKCIYFLQLNPPTVLYYQKLRLAYITLAQKKMTIEVVCAIVVCLSACPLQHFD